MFGRKTKTKSLKFENEVFRVPRRQQHIWLDYKKYNAFGKGIDINLKQRLIKYKLN